MLCQPRVVASNLARPLVVAGARASALLSQGMLSNKQSPCQLAVMPSPSCTVALRALVALGFSLAPRAARVGIGAALPTADSVNAPLICAIFDNPISSALPNASAAVSTETVKVERR